MIHLNIVPFLGDKRMDEVNVATIQQFYDWMASASQYGRQKNLNEKTIERVGGLTSRIFKVAKDMGLIEETPFKSTLLSIRAEKAGHRSAFKHLGIVGFCAYDFRTTFATQLKESGMATSAIADLMGHADTRMVETVYARTRKEGVMKHLDALEARNA